MQVLREAEAKRLLREAGVPVPEGVELRSVADARRAAEDLGYPLVCKVSRDGLVHKTEADGVVLGVGDDETLAAVVARLLTLAGDDGGVLVERQAGPGVELLVGIRRDAVFGPLVVVGMGGIYAEVLRDTAVRLCPVSPKDAEAALRELRGAPLLLGARGRPPVDLASLADLVARLSRWALARTDVVEVDLNPVIANADGVVAVDATVWLGEPESAAPEPDLPTVETFFSPRSVAVVGASADPRKAGNIILENLRRFGFPGRIVPVHPSAENILGMPAYPSLAAIPEPADLAVVVVPRDHLAQVVDDAATAGTRHLIVATAGFADRGADGLEDQRDLLARAAAAGVRIMGPNSIGVVNAHTGLATSITTLRTLPPGPVALFGQTGTFASGYANQFATRRWPRIGKIACIGNKGGVDDADLLRYFAADADTSTIGIYTEGVGRRAFLDALREVEGCKPVVILRAGRTEEGRAAVAGHTGSLTGNNATYDAAFRATGAIAVDDVDDLLLTLDAFDRLPLPGGKRAAVVSITGIGCVLASDAAAEQGINLPQPGEDTLTAVRRWIPSWAPARNPYDIWSAIEKHGPGEAYSGIAGTVVADPDIDALLLVFVLIDESELDPASLVRHVRARAPDKPVFATFFGGAEEQLQGWTRTLQSAGALVTPTPAAAFRVLGRLADHAARRHL